MMAPVARIDGERANPIEGRIVIDWPKAIWNGGMLASVLIFAVPLFSLPAFAMFLILTYATLLVGHSVGMHRMMIHRAFRCGKPLQRLLIYIGVLVGVAGPFGIIRIHDVRDWAQRQRHCHDFFAHRRSLACDLLWQLTCRFAFVSSPLLRIEPDLADDPWIKWMERTWRWHQLLLGIPLYAIGGWGWVVWGICARVFVSAAGHWTITYFCHNPGPGLWHVRGAGIQASNLPGLGLLTYGECWHNNHHAFPESARIGLEPGQLDPAWWLIAALQQRGWVHDVGVPRPDARRDDLLPLPS